MIRIVDFVCALVGLILLFPLLILLFIIGLFDTGSPLFIQTRVGRNEKPFKLVKFRSMNVSAKQVATHLADKKSITKYGAFLRKTKLDELPQLWNVLIGQMSLVGPRPCLYNQLELVEERRKRQVFDVRPGITGLAQINDIDMSTPKLLAETDMFMIEKMTSARYFSYIIKTFLP